MSTKMVPPAVSIVIPTRNEAPNIVPLVARIHSSLSDLPHEIIFVDDASDDGTPEVIHQLIQHDPLIRVVQRTCRGLSTAVMAGFQIAQAPVMGVMDADLSHDERILPTLYAAIQNGAELSIGSRRVPGGGADKWPWHRRFMSSIATQLTRLCLQIPIHDPMSGYFLVRRSMYESCREHLFPRGYKILLELYCRARPSTVCEVPYVFKDRHQSHSKMNLWTVVDFLRSVAALMGNRL